MSADGGDVNINAIDGEAGMQSGTFNVFLGATLAELSPSGITNELDINSATIGFGYSFGDNYRLDASHTELNFDIGGASADTNLQEVGFGYTRCNIFGRFAIAQGDDDSGLDNLYSLVGGYSMSPDTEVSLSVHFVDDAADVIDEPVYILKTEYAPGNWGVSFDAANITDGTDTLRLVSLGGH